MRALLIDRFCQNEPRRGKTNGPPGLLRFPCPTEWLAAIRECDVFTGLVPQLLFFSSSTSEWEQFSVTSFQKKKAAGIAKKV